MPAGSADAIKVPHLRKKLNAIYLLGSGIEGDTELGRRFASDGHKGITAKAIRNWIYGEGPREADMVPAARFEALVKIFKESLPGSRSCAETSALLCSPGLQPWLAALLPAGAPVDWARLALDAPSESVNLLSVEQGNGLRITTRPHPSPPAGNFVTHPVGKPFCLQLQAPMDGWTTLIQYVEGRCFALDIADQGPILPVKERETTTVPPSPPWFEEDCAGHSRYLFLTGPVPMPRDVASRLATAVATRVELDISTLDRIACLVDPEYGFALRALDVHFVDR